MEKRKIINIILIGAIILVGILIVIASIWKFLPKEELACIGEITNIQENTIVVKDKESGMYYSFNAGGITDYEIGDTIKVYTKEELMETYPVQVVPSNVEVVSKSSTVPDNEDGKETSDPQNNNNETNQNNSDNSSSNSGSSNNNTSSNNNSTNNNQTNEPPVQTKNEEDVITYFRTLDNNLNTSSPDATLGQKIKAGFVTIVDFLFYDGTIAGYKFSELTDKAKTQVLKIAASIDTKIDNIFPGYKEAISKTTGRIYTNIKNKVVSTYLNVTTKICTNDPATCAQAKADFQDLKKYFSLSWNFLLDLAKSAGASFTEWWKIWSAN